MAHLREDVTDQSGAENYVPPDFKTLINNALWARNIAPEHVPNAVLQQLYQDAYQDTTINLAYNSVANDPLAYQGNVQTLINSMLFSTSSTSPSLLAEATGIRIAQGQTPTPAELAAAGHDPLIAASEQVPNPFGKETTVSGLDWGDAGGTTGPTSGYYNPVTNPTGAHEGVDYGTAPGTLIAAPFAGTVTVERNVPWYGNLVSLKMANGYTLRFGHVADGLASGRVEPGQVIARSGVNQGVAQGSVTLVELMDPNGALVNPHLLLDPIQKGVTFASMAASLGVQDAATLAGTGIVHSTALDTSFPGAKGAFVSYFGRLPTDAELTSVALAGGPNQDAASMEDYVRSLPSHVPGIAIGAYADLRKTVDSASLRALGHAGSDAVVKELYDAKTTSPADVKYWYDSHSPNQVGVDNATYNAAYLANAAYTQAVYQDNPHPATIFDQIQAHAATATPTPPTEQATVAATAPLPPEPVASNGGGGKPMMDQ